jgi:hypothetical protein
VRAFAYLPQAIAARLARPRGTRRTVSVHAPSSHHERPLPFASGVLVVAGPRVGPEPVNGCHPSIADRGQRVEERAVNASCLFICLIHVQPCNGPGQLGRRATSRLVDSPARRDGPCPGYRVRRSSHQGLERSRQPLRTASDVWTLARFPAQAQLGLYPSAGALQCRGSRKMQVGDHRKCRCAWVLWVAVVMVGQRLAITS